MRTKNQVRHRCERLVAGLCLPVPFDLEAFRLNLAEQRKRPLILIPLPRPTAPELPSGMWLATEHADHVFYDGQTSPLHRQHIIFHEIGHMLFDHYAAGLADNAGLYRHAGPVNPALIRRILARIRYSEKEEQEAELFATLLLEVLEHAPQEPRNSYLARLAEALGYRTYR